MFCPNCSQQQISDEMRFCSRCGFPLGGVRHLIDSGGAIGEREVPPSPALKGMRRGVWILLLAFVLLMFAGLITAIEEDFAPLLVFPVLCFLIGFVRLLYGAFLEERWKRGKRESRAEAPPMIVGTSRAELPPQGLPVEPFSTQKGRTKEMAQPPSVTENTTRLLEDDGQTHRS